MGNTVWKMDGKEEITVKKKVRAISWILSFVMAFQIMLCSEIVVNAKEDEKDSFTISVEKELKNEPLQISVSAAKEGQYTVQLVYHTVDEKITAVQAGITVNGSEMQTIQLQKYWTTEEEYRVDGAGNQFAAEQILCTEDMTHHVMQIVDYKYEEYIAVLNEGDNTLVITPIEGSVYIKEIIFTEMDAVDDYTNLVISDNELYKGDSFCVEGEKAVLKNSYWLTAQSDGSSSDVSEADAVKTKINYIGGSNWKEVGDTIYWEIETKEAGWYAIDFSYQQSYVINGSTYRELRVNGELPYEQAKSIGFPYTTKWKELSFADENGTPYLVWLEKGENTLSLTAVVGAYAEVCTLLETVLGELGDIYLDINMVTGDSVDIYRDYQLFNQIENFNERLDSCLQQLEEIDATLLEMSEGNASSYAGSIRNMKQVVKLMLENPYTAHRYKSTYYSNYTVLNTCLNDMQDTPLDLDKITFRALNEDKEKGFLEKASAFFKEMIFELKRFVGSFSEDYNSISGVADAQKEEERESITVWVNWGRDQAQVLNNLIQSSFSEEHDVDVNVKITNATVIQGELSGKGPDVVLQQPRTEPVNLAMRGVLYDLSTFEDYEEVICRFSEGAEIPYTYQDGTYALPDTQTFMVLFYRTDIFDQLGISVPTTWEEFQSVSKVILRNNLTVWLPYTQITDMNIVNTGVGSLNIFPTMVMQNGMSLYSEDYRSTTLTSSEAIELFRDWTSYYTKMKLPYQLDFYNRFRTGTCPMGIAPYTTYNTLKDTGNEIEGQWQIAPLPGVRQEDGSINNASAGGGTGCAILKDAESPEAAWEFLKWWTSAETQLAYSNSLEAVLGTVGRVAVSNVEAFENMSWDSSMQDVLTQSLENTVEVNEIPGSYYVSRALDFAFWNVVNQNENEKDMLLTWGEEADKEIHRKWVQYNGE